MATTGDPSATPGAAPWAVSRGAAEAGELGRCVWCGAPFARTDAEPGRGRRDCVRCGTATTYPWPSPAELEHAYAHYRPEDGRFSWLGDAVLRRTRARLAARIDRVAPPGPVLDVGAGDGALLDALHVLGREAIGLERDSRREDVREADLTEVEGHFAAIVFWHSLEHLPSPGASIDHAAQRLMPRGVLFVAVPNGASLQARVFGDRWFHLDLPRHLVHLSTRALTGRMRALGLAVTRVSHWRGGQMLFGWLHGLVGTLPSEPDLYDAIRRPEARSRPLSHRQRALALAAAAVLFPIAAAATVLEVAVRRGGTVYVEARRG
jgi:SAM-dependent methyltransferase